VYNLRPAPITDVNSKNPIGEFVIAIWNALAEYSNTVTLWILSAKWRHLDDNNGSLYIGLYQTDAAINPWNSGGPLINLNEEVIWVNTAITTDGQWIGFAIPISKQLVEATLDSIEKYGAIKRPLLWIQFIQINKTIAKKYHLPAYKWVLVQNVIPNTPAYVAWIKKWDIILQIDWYDITTDNPIIYRLFTHKIWDTVTLLINRDGKLIKKEVKLFAW
jgi:S1-C subfamily serine protease